MANPGTERRYTFPAPKLPLTDPLITVSGQDFNTLLDDYWSQMDAEFGRVGRKTSTNYWVNVIINIIIVSLGVGLVVVSMYHGLTVGADLFSGITSGIGVTDFVAIFLVNPQSKIRRALADLVQMQMIYAAWANQATAAYIQLVNDKFTDTAISTFNATMKDVTNQAVNSIETNIATS